MPDSRCLSVAQHCALAKLWLNSSARASARSCSLATGAATAVGEAMMRLQAQEESAAGVGVGARRGGGFGSAGVCTPIHAAGDAAGPSCSLPGGRAGQQEAGPAPRKRRVLAQEPGRGFAGPPPARDGPGPARGAGRPVAQARPTASRVALACWFLATEMDAEARQQAVQDPSPPGRVPLQCPRTCLSRSAPLSSGRQVRTLKERQF